MLEKYEGKKYRHRAGAFQQASFPPVNYVEIRSGVPVTVFFFNKEEAWEDEKDYPSIVRFIESKVWHEYLPPDGL